MDHINTAIDKNCKVRFQYAGYNNRKRKEPRHEVDVELQCETFIMNSIVDHFGTKVRTQEIDDNHFKATVTISPSPTFYRWVFGWNGAMKILGPDNVKGEYKAMVIKALDT